MPRRTLSRPRRYQLAIAAVDTVTGYVCESDRASSVIAFLQLHDHEGASLSLRVTSGALADIPEEYFGEDAYRRLEAGVVDELKQSQEP
jgi:hypothetical protein